MADGRFPNWGRWRGRAVDGKFVDGIGNAEGWRRRVRAWRRIQEIREVEWRIWQVLVDFQREIQVEFVNGEGRNHRIGRRLGEGGGSMSRWREREGERGVNVRDVNSHRSIASGRFRRRGGQGWGQGQARGNGGGELSGGEIDRGEEMGGDGAVKGRTTGEERGDFGNGRDGEEKAFCRGDALVKGETRTGVGGEGE